MTNIFITEKTQRLLRVMFDHDPGQAQDLARASSMLRAAEMLGRHEKLGGVETDADLHSMLVLLDLAQQCPSRTEAGKIAYFNANWDKVSPFYHDGYRAQETFARELGLPGWVQMKVFDGTWNPNPKKTDAAQTAVETEAPAVQFTRTQVDRLDGQVVVKATNQSSGAVHYEIRRDSVAGELVWNDKFDRLSIARGMIGKEIATV